MVTHACIKRVTHVYLFFIAFTASHFPDLTSLQLTNSSIKGKHLNTSDLLILDEEDSDIRIGMDVLGHVPKYEINCTKWDFLISIDLCYYVMICYFCWWQKHCSIMFMDHQYAESWSFSFENYVLSMWWWNSCLTSLCYFHRDDKPLSENINVVGNDLVIKGPVETNHSGQYQCHASFYSHAASLRFKIEVKPRFQVSGTFIVSQNSTVQKNNRLS